jgi:hypothetical protein
MHDPGNKAGNEPWHTSREFHKRQRVNCGVAG